MDNYYDTTSSYDYSSTSDMAGLAAMSAGMIIINIIIGIAAYVFVSICLGKIFKKAGIDSWIAWVPFYNSWKMLEMGDQKGAYIFFAFIPFVGSIIFAVFAIMSIYKINLKFGKGIGFFFLALFASPVWYAILAFDKSTWNGIGTAAITPMPYPTYARPVEQPQMNGQQPQMSVNPIAPQPAYQPQPQQMPAAPTAPSQTPATDQQQPQITPRQYF